MGFYAISMDFFKEKLREENTRKSDSDYRIGKTRVETISFRAFFYLNNHKLACQLEWAYFLQHFYINQWSFIKFIVILYQFHGHRKPLLLVLDSISQKNESSHMNK